MQRTTLTKLVLSWIMCENKATLWNEGANQNQMTLIPFIGRRCMEPVSTCFQQLDEIVCIRHNMQKGQNMYDWQFWNSSEIEKQTKHVVL
jgi:hypothetical protein